MCDLAGSDQARSENHHSWSTEILFYWLIQPGHLLKLYNMQSYVLGVFFYVYKDQ